MPFGRISTTFFVRVARTHRWTIFIRNVKTVFRFTKDIQLVETIVSISKCDFQLSKQRGLLPLCRRIKIATAQLLRFPRIMHRFHNASDRFSRCSFSGSRFTFNLTNGIGGCPRENCREIFLDSPREIFNVWSISRVTVQSLWLDSRRSVVVFSSSGRFFTRQCNARAWIRGGPWISLRYFHSSGRFLARRLKVCIQGGPWISSRYFFHPVDFLGSS